MANRKRRKVKQALPNKSPNQSATKGSSTSLQDLPDELIQKIFGYGSPYNNLPLVNSYFNKLLKFDPDYKGDGECKNLSLAMEIIKTNYLVSLNQKLDFNEIQKSIDSFKHSIEGHERNYHNSPHLHKMKNNLVVFEFNIQKFRKQKHGLSSYVLHHKTLSVRMLDEVEERFPGVVILVPENLELEVEMRLAYCLFSCEITSYYDNILKNLPEKGEPLDNHEEELMLQKIRRFSTPYLEMQDVKSPILLAESGLDYGDSIVKCKKYIPYALYRDGITMNSQCELILRLVNLGFGIRNVDTLFLHTLSCCIFKRRSS